jgi:hypothetical protein
VLAVFLGLRVSGKVFFINSFVLMGLILSLGRPYGRLRFLQGWLSSLGQQLQEKY